MGAAGALGPAPCSGSAAGADQGPLGAAGAGCCADALPFSQPFLQYAHHDKASHGGSIGLKPAAPGGVWAGFSIMFGGLKTGVKCDAHWTEMAPWEGRIGL